MDTTTYNRAQYLAWLRRDFPALYRDMVPQSDVTDVAKSGDFSQLLRWESPGIASTRHSGHPSLAGFLDSALNTFNTVVSNVTNSLPQLAQTYTQYSAQKDLLKINTDRAHAGLGPLQYVNGRLTTAQGLPYTPDEGLLASTGGLSTTALLGFAAAAGFGIILLMRGSRRR
jgi:hypothetical protein